MKIIEVRDLILVMKNCKVFWSLLSVVLLFWIRNICNWMFGVRVYLKGKFFINILVL